MEDILYSEGQKKFKSGQYPPLFVAAVNGLINVTDFLLSQCKVNINEVYGNETALLLAIRNKHVKVVERLLLEPTINVNGQCSTTPLHRAIYASKELTEMVLNHKKSDINETNRTGLTAFSKACRRCTREVIDVFLSAKYADKIKTDSLDVYNRTASHMACETGNFEIVQLLVDRGLYHTNYRGGVGGALWTPFQMACNEGQFNTVNYLLSKSKQLLFGQSRAYVFKYISGGLELACMNGHVDIVKLLMTHSLYMKANQTELKCHLWKCIGIAINHHKVQLCVYLIGFVDTTSNASSVDTALSKFKENVWLPHKQIVRELFLLWLNLIMKYPWPLIDYEKLQNFIYGEIVGTFKSLFQSTEVDIRLLYFAMSNNISELTNILISQSQAISRDKLSMPLKHKGISLLHSSTRHKELRDIMNREFGIDFSEPTTDLGSLVREHEISKDISTSIKSSSKLKSDQVVPLNKTIEYSNDVLKKNMMHILDKYRHYGHRINHTSTKEEAEKKLILQTVKTFMEFTSKEISKINPLFRFRPIQVGSSKEGTRSYMPDEFDFMLFCEEIQPYLKVSIIKTEVLPQVFINVRQNGFRSLLPYLNNDNSFDFMKFKDEMDVYFETAALAVVQNGQCGGNIFIDENCFEKRNISCITLQWRGQYYHDMPIKIDIVPVLQCPETLKSLTKQPCKLYIFCKGENVYFEQPAYKIAYSEVELKLIKELPAPAKQALKLAKGLRVTRMFPQDIIDQLCEVYSIEDCLKTYMLKMSLLICFEANRGNKDMESLSKEEWVYMVFIHLEYSLYHYGIIPSMFALATEDHLFYCRESKDIKIEHERRCCVERKNLLLLVAFLRCTIQTQVNLDEKQLLLNYMAKEAIDFGLNKNMKASSNTNKIPKVPLSI